jgi:succinyl-CoA synthetase alpha subunit
MFSDNVPVEDEVALKKLAVEKGLLMMGPDCGTAIINGEPICFANVVPRGKIGIVSASGTGLQEVSCLIADAGQGVSQALGTGGRDLKVAEVGGMMMTSCIQALSADSETEVILVISKPPLASLTDAVISELEKSGKPCVVHFVGAAAEEARGEVRYAGNLTEAARMAAAIAAGDAAGKSGGGAAGGTAGKSGSGAAGADFDLPEAEIERIVKEETRGMSARQKYLRGMFVGGTLTDEAATVLSDLPGGVHSFDAADPKLKLKDPHTSVGHTIVDLGEDVFTVGRPHPMIDPSIRTERMERETLDEEVAVWLLDVVLGYGSHDDPAGAMIEYIKGAKRTAEENKNYLSVIASITGTEGDPQGFAGQKAKLEAAGVVVMPSNFQAALLAKRIMEARNE